MKNIISQRFGVKKPMLVCGEEILDASYDDMLLCDSIVTDGAVVILQKMPVTVSLTDKGTCFNFYVPQVYKLLCMQSYRHNNMHVCF